MLDSARECVAAFETALCFSRFGGACHRFCYSLDFWRGDHGEGGGTIEVRKRAIAGREGVRGRRR